MGAIVITVNGQPVEVPGGLTLLEALRRHGIELPTLCHDQRLTPYGGCRLCVVARRDGRPGLVPACSTPALAGMKIDTEAPEVHEARRRQLQLILLNHRMECPVCDRTGDCRLQDLVFEYGADEGRLPFELVRRKRDESSPLIVRDPEKCILCAKCVRLCDEVQGVAAIGVIGRGLEARVSTWLDGPLDCEFCGQCVDACPVAALTIPAFASELPAWQRTAVDYHLLLLLVRLRAHRDERWDAATRRLGRTGEPAESRQAVCQGALRLGRAAPPRPAHGTAGAGPRPTRRSHLGRGARRRRRPGSPQRASGAR